MDGGLQQNTLLSAEHRQLVADLLRGFDLNSRSEVVRQGIIALHHAWTHLGVEAVSELRAAVDLWAIVQRSRQHGRSILVVELPPDSAYQIPRADGRPVARLHPLASPTHPLT